MSWHIEDAKNNFSEVVRRALTEGPQTVTVRGRRAAVVISAEEYDRLVSSKLSIVNYILAGPAWDDELIEEVNCRDKKPSRLPVF